VVEPTVDQWEMFASELARSAYREGWTRGYEWAERDLDAKPKHDPEVLAEQLAHAWKLSDAPRVEELMRADDPTNPLAGIAEEHHPMLLDEMGIQTGGWRIVIDEPEKKSSDK
jgi:hypothetical protein